MEKLGSRFFIGKRRFNRNTLRKCNEFPDFIIYQIGVKREFVVEHKGEDHYCGKQYAESSLFKNLFFRPNRFAYKFQQVI